MEWRRLVQHFSLTKMNIFKNKYSVESRGIPTARPGIAVVILLLLFVSNVYTADTTGQKAHFQVEDKSGDLKITATKDEASVTAQADSVQVVVKPGTATYPVLKSDKPIVHVNHPVWSSICFRKSAILKRKKSLKQRVRPGNNPSLYFKKPDLKHLKKSTPRNQRGRGFIGHLRAKHKDGFFKKKSHRRRKPLVVQDFSGSKKSNIKGFHVSGNAGKLKMHVTKDGTELSSESGGVDISLNKAPSSSSSSSKSRDQHSLQAQADLNKVHLATELEDSFAYVGLRKSVVTKFPDNKTDWD